MSEQLRHARARVVTAMDALRQARELLTQEIDPPQPPPGGGDPGRTNGEDDGQSAGGRLAHVLRVEYGWGGSHVIHQIEFAPNTTTTELVGEYLHVTVCHGVHETDSGGGEEIVVELANGLEDTGWLVLNDLVVTLDLDNGKDRSQVPLFGGFPETTIQPMGVLAAAWHSAGVFDTYDPSCRLRLPETLDAKIRARLRNLTDKAAATAPYAFTWSPNAASATAGFGVAPYEHAWARSAAGWELRAFEMLGCAMGWRHAVLDERGNPKVVGDDWGMWQTGGEPLVGFGAYRDDPGTHQAALLMALKDPDEQHLGRFVFAALQFLEYAPTWSGYRRYAIHFLERVVNLLEIAEGMGPEFKYNPSPKAVQRWPMSEKLARMTKGPRSWGGRALYHKVRVAYYCAMAGIPGADDLMAMYAELTLRLAGTHGITKVEKASKGANPGHPGPWIWKREADFLLHQLLLLTHWTSTRGLPTLNAGLRAQRVTLKGWYTDPLSVETSFSLDPTITNASNAGLGGAFDRTWYHGFTHELYGLFVDAKGLIAHAERRSPTENPLACFHPKMYESELRAS